jgi:hypothetical protein
MNCKDLKELLSAYADGELVGTQRDFIEEHLESCADCRALLADYTKTRGQLLSLRAIPSIPDIKQATMSKIKMAKAPAKLRRWLRPALVGIPVIAILATVLPLYLSDSSPSPAGVLAKAYAAVGKLESYRYSKDEYTQLHETDEPVHSFHVDLEYVSPDRYHITSEITEEYSHQDARRTEEIVIGDKLYTYKSYIYHLRNSEFYNQFAPTKEKTEGALDVLTKIETMADEDIDGTDCYHYKGDVDIEKWLDWTRSNLERLLKGIIERYPGIFDFEEMIRTVEDMWRTYERTYEFWIGKDDYLIRQWKLTNRDLTDKSVVGYPYKIVAYIKYYDFNEPIAIEPPLTESGELLPGWRVTSLWE